MWNSPKSDASLSHKARILVADDDVVYGVAAIEVLEHAGFEALLVGTGHAAMTAFTQIRPDLILLDVELPDANGFDLCTRLRSTAAGTDIPIVMVTGHDNRRHHRRRGIASLASPRPRLDCAWNLHPIGGRDGRDRFAG